MTKLFRLANSTDCLTWCVVIVTGDNTTIHFHDTQTQAKEHAKDIPLDRHTTIYVAKITHQSLDVQ